MSAATLAHDGLGGASPSTAIAIDRETRRPDEVLALYAFTSATLAGLAGGLGLMAMLFWSSAPRRLFLAWAALFIGLWLVRIALAQAFSWRFRLHREQGVPLDWLGWQRGWNVLTLCSACTWGLAGWIFYTHAGDIQETGLIVTIYTFCIAVVPVLGNHPRMFVAYVTICFTPLIVRIALEDSIYHYQLAGMLAVIVSLTTVLARNYRHTLQRMLEHKLRADGLAAQLRIEKQSAEQARAEAEVANRAKTQFFSAASHDLRQPLHAMGLFAEALRQRVREPELAQLVNSINASVDALEGLFSELLDITRIDAGGIEVRPSHFAIGDIWRKLDLHFTPSAFEKGLDLRLRGQAQIVHADALLVERVMRNLVANAIRYTEDGGVLVAARARGNEVWLQVWDSGIGICAEDQAHVYEEFFQVPQGAALQPAQRKGLGLGLSIVKRLADLMGARVALCSQPGRGTVFTLVLPRGRETEQSQPVVAIAALPGPQLLDRQIVVIEDEAAVREGLQVLLQSWGAQVAAFDSLPALQAWLDSEAALRPHLIIADYRLASADATGLNAIAVLRQHFGAKLPALVVTGSAISGLEPEAQAQDFHLLMKPVVPNKLRAMVTFKLGMAQSQQQAQPPSQAKPA